MCCTRTFPNKLTDIILITLWLINKAGCDRKQIVTSVSIVSCFMPFLEYRDNDSGLRPSSYPYMLGKGIKQVTIDTLVTICILMPS